MRVDGVEAGEHHRLQLFESGQRLDRRIGVVRNGVTDLSVGNVLHVGDKEPDFAGR